MLGFSPFKGKRQYTYLLRHSLVSLTNTFRVFVFLVLALLTWESGPCLKSCALKKAIHNSGFSINISDLHLAVKKLTKSIINTSVLAASTIWKVKLWDKPSFKRHLRKKTFYKLTLSSESFIQKRLQSYPWSLEHLKDHLYLLNVMLMNTLTCKQLHFWNAINFFPITTRVFGCVVEELFISDVDTWLSIDHCYFDICF